MLSGVPVNSDGTFTGTFPAPGPGLHTITATYNPAPGNSIGSATSPPTTITVGPATSTITQTVTPNPAPPGGPVTVAGTVTNTDGTSPAGGTVIVYVRHSPPPLPDDCFAVFITSLKIMLIHISIKDSLLSCLYRLQLNQ